MNRVKTVVFSALQVLVIAAILLFILWGLARIGLVEAPEFLAPLIGKGADDARATDGDSAASFLKKADSETQSVKRELTLDEESVEELLAKLTVAENYDADVTTVLYTTAGERSARYLLRKRGDVVAAVRIGSGEATRVVVDDGGTLSIYEKRGARMRSAQYARRETSFESEIGAVLSFKDFLARADDPAYTFSLLAEDGGAVLSVLFDSASGEYRQTQRYKIDLDHALVTEAVCFEDGVKIYEMTLKLRGEDVFDDVQIANEYRTVLESAFGVPSEEQQNG